MHACKNQETQNTAKTASTQEDISIESISNQIQKSPKKATLYAQRATLYSQMGDLQLAIKDLTIANALDSLNPFYYISLADFYIQLGNSGITASLLNKANALIPDNVEILYRLGSLYFYVQDYNKSMVYLNETLTLDPYYSMAYFTKALLLLEKGDTALAVSNLQIAVEREPEYYDAYIQLALLFAGKNNELALNYFDNALNLFPESFEALYGKAFFLQNNYKPEEAIKTYQTILKTTSKNNYQIYYNIAYNYMLNLEEYNLAINYYDSAIASIEKFPEALCNRAYCYEQIGKQNKAHEDYREALIQRPNYEIALKGINRINKQ